MSVVIDGTSGITLPDGNEIDGGFTTKAWINFNGTGTVAIRDSGNVSSITDNGTGFYGINFATALANDDYAVTGSGDRPGYTRALAFTPDGSLTNPFSTTSVEVFFENASGGKTDPEFASIIVAGV
jgi:hypothetical protein